MWHAAPPEAEHLPGLRPGGDANLDVPVKGFVVQLNAEGRLCYRKVQSVVEVASVALKHRMRTDADADVEVPGRPATRADRATPGEAQGRTIVDAGPDAINPLEPVAGMDIRRVKEAYGDRVCLVGNIDCGELLSHGTRGQVDAAVCHCLAAASPGGGFILSSSNSIHSSVNPDNYLAMVEAGHAYGLYE